MKLEFIIAFWNSIDWQALSSIATFIMAIVTYLTLRELKRQSDERFNREVIDKICVPLITDIEHIRRYCGLIEFPVDSAYGLNIDNQISKIWCWINIKRKFPTLLYRLPKDLLVFVDHFHERLLQIINTYEQYFPELEEIISEELYPLFIKREDYDPYRSNPVKGRNSFWRFFTREDFALKNSDS